MRCSNFFDDFSESQDLSLSKAAARSFYSVQHYDGETLSDGNVIPCQLLRSVGPSFFGNGIIIFFCESPRVLQYIARHRCQSLKNFVKSVIVDSAYFSSSVIL